VQVVFLDAMHVSGASLVSILAIQVAASVSLMARSGRSRNTCNSADHRPGACMLSPGKTPTDPQYTSKTFHRRKKEAASLWPRSSPKWPRREPHRRQRRRSRFHRRSANGWTHGSPASPPQQQTDTASRSSTSNRSLAQCVSLDCDRTTSRIFTARWQAKGSPARPSGRSTGRFADPLLASDPDWGALVAVIAWTGCRRGEIVGLRWEDVGIKQGNLLIRRSVAAVPGGSQVKRTKTGDIRRSPSVRKR
jgi:integrase